MTERVDMSAFESQFNEDRYSHLMPNDEFERLAFLRTRIEDIEGTKSVFESDAERLEKTQKRINEALAEIRRIEMMLLNRRRPIDEQIAGLDKIRRHNRTTKESLERELARLLDEIAARERFLAHRDALLAATDDMPWRIGVDGKKALPHQLEGAHRLVSAERALLGDKPGLGKTLQAIMIIDMLRAQGKGQKVLIFTPKSVLRDFERAFQRWTKPTFVHVLNQTAKGIKLDILDSLAHWPQMVVITNYEVWRKDITIKLKLKACGFDTIFVDEAHVMKNDKSVTTKGIRELVYADNRCPKCGHGNIVEKGYGIWAKDPKCAACEYVQEKVGDFCSVKNFYPLTGTPILNKPQELWPLLNMIDREGFPSEKSFLEDYCSKQYDYTNERYFWTFGPGGSERLLKKLGMKYTARTRESAGVVMPPQEIKHHYLELDPEKYPRQFKFIELLREKARLAFSDTHQMTMDATLAWYTRMRQAASWPDGIKVRGCAHDPECLDEYGVPGNCYDPTIIFPPPDAPPVNESIILDETEDIIREAVESGDRIVVFSMFKSVLNELERRTEDLRTAKLVGGLGDKVRQRYIDDFNANETKVGEHKYDVLFAQYQTAKVGLNLHGAQQLVCVEREWNPGMEEQTLDRLRRIDSQFNSTVHLIHCAGTATELIDAIQEQKKNMLDDHEANVGLMEAMRKFLEG